MKARMYCMCRGLRVRGPWSVGEARRVRKRVGVCIALMARRSSPREVRTDRRYPSKRGTSAPAPCLSDSAKIGGRSAAGIQR